MVSDDIPQLPLPEIPSAWKKVIGNPFYVIGTMVMTGTLTIGGLSLSDWRDVAKAVPDIAAQNKILIVQNKRLEKWNQLLWVKLSRLKTEVDDDAGPPKPMALELEDLTAEELPELPSQ